MAPRRGGGSAGGYSSDSCPGAFSDLFERVYLAMVVLFLVVYIGISIAQCCVHKRSGAGKKLTGAPYMLSLALMILAYGFGLVYSVGDECGALDYQYTTTFALMIADDILYYLGNWGLLFVVFYTLNTMLRERLGLTMVFKIMPLVILGILFAIQFGFLGLHFYNNGELLYGSSGEYFLEEVDKLGLANSVLFLVAVVASGALSMMSVFAMRSRGLPGGVCCSPHASMLILSSLTAYQGLVRWVVILYVTLLIRAIIGLVSYVVSNLTWKTSIALVYITDLCLALSFVFLLCIAKHVSWSKTTTVTPGQFYTPGTQQQTTYDYNTNGQYYQYQQTSPYPHYP
ncbi:hypothetical protein BDW02DRAFT_581227 [Decorospora gaudefroyi]|uniref:RTA1-domain-containing protein n=1 Tax=Decorospora gaudefroyi TaxID=184978 RepID=A0A6A5K6Q2_9PLEO|nr:hypothetical protein BDW02DRAFT_581227 [Decorospora gaudefroyi]